MKARMLGVMVMLMVAMVSRLSAATNQVVITNVCVKAAASSWEYDAVTNFGSALVAYYPEVTNGGMSEMVGVGAERRICFRYWGETGCSYQVEAWLPDHREEGRYPTELVSAEERQAVMWSWPWVSSDFGQWRAVSKAIAGTNGWIDFSQGMLCEQMYYRVSRTGP